MIFTSEQVDFIKKETGINVLVGKNNLTRETWIKIKEQAFEVEIEETTDGPLTKRGCIAAEICDMRYS